MPRGVARAIVQIMRATAAVLFFAVSAAVAAADWPQFLGPSRDGRSTERVVAEFGTDGPDVAWKVAVGSGFAGPAIADGRVVLFHRVGGEAVLEAWAADDGMPLWRRAWPTAYRDDFGFDNGPRSTPTIHGEVVVAYGADGRLVCVKAATGELVWEKDLAELMEAPKGWFGRACAPLVVGDLVHVLVGGRWQGKPAGVAAFRISDGSVAWTASEDEASYSSPVLMRFGGRPALVCLLRSGVEWIDPENGSPLAREDFKPDIAASVSACTPIATGPNQVFVSGCYGMGARVWEMDETFKIKSVWSKPDVLDCHYGTPVVHDGLLIGFHGRQEEGTHLRCVRAADGEGVWSAALPAGSVTLAGGSAASEATLVVLTEKGELILAPATSKGFEPTARGQILGATTRAYPALSGGRLFARDGKTMVAVKLRSE